MESFLNSGDFKKALEAADNILLISPDNEMALFLRSQLLLLFRKLRDADKTINRVIELYPQNHHAYLSKAVITVLYTYDIKSAIFYIDKGLLLKQDCYELIIAKAQMLYWLKDPAYNLWIEQASGIDSVRTENFLKKYWIEKLPTPISHITSEIRALYQTLMFLASQQGYGGWK